MDLGRIGENLIDSLRSNYLNQTQSIDQTGRVANASINNAANQQGILFSTRPGLDQLRNFSEQTLPAQAEQAQQVAQGTIQVRQSVADSIRKINESNQAAIELGKIYDNTAFNSAIQGYNESITAQNNPITGNIEFEGNQAPVISGGLSAAPVTSVYGANEAFRNGVTHTGIDYGIPQGTPLYTPYDGEVVYSGLDQFGGAYTDIKHANGYTSRYLHLSRLDLQPGQKVVAGQQLGLSGGADGTYGAGLSTGAHLDLQLINPSGQNVDPNILFDERIF